MNLRSISHVTYGDAVFPVRLDACCKDIPITLKFTC